MSVFVNVSPELRQWLLHNFERGCSADAIARSMIAQRFDPAIAQGLVSAFAQARAAGVEPPRDGVTLEAIEAEYRYEISRLAPGPLIRTHDREIRVASRAAQPVLALLNDVLSDAECAELIELARPRLQPSTVVDPATGAEVTAQYRSSDSMFFRPQETPFIARIDRRLSEIMNCPLEHGEGLQVLRYGPACGSEPHFDFLIPSNHTNIESLARSGQRISTLVVYLNDVADGGETCFPELGLAVSPLRGNGVYFEYANSLRQVDRKSLHASAAVRRGEKWALTKWMRERRFIAAGNA